MLETGAMVAAIVAVLAVVLDKTLPLIRTKNGHMSQLDRIEQEISTIKQDITIIKRYTGELHKWHDKEDEEGVKVWYIRQSLERAIQRLADAAEAQTRLLERVMQDLDEIKSS